MVAAVLPEINEETAALFFFPPLSIIPRSSSYWMLGLFYLGFTSTFLSSV
jgi:hypothetical protein